jgi:hypothetical protein
MPHSPVQVQAVKDARTKVLGALEAAAATTDPKAALSALAEVRKLDPTGAVLGTRLAESTLASGDNNEAIRWANEVLGQPSNSQAALKAAEDVVAKATKAGGTAPAAPAATEPKAGPYDSLDAACKAITMAISGATGPGLSRYLGTVKDVTCEPDATLEVKQDNLKQAVPLRIAVKGENGSQLLGWVAIETAKGWLLHGPVQNAFAPGSYGVSNDYAIALERAEVLPGGSSEIVVRVVERFTLLDLALNEATEVDQTRVVILTLDREGVVESKPFVLSRSQKRSVIDTGEAALPKGWKPSKGLGKTEEFALKVQWSIPNGIRLEKGEGDLKPPFVGNITLFPEPSGPSADPAP